MTLPENSKSTCARLGHVPMPRIAREFSSGRVPLEGDAVFDAFHEQDLGWAHLHPLVGNAWE